MKNTCFAFLLTAALVQTSSARTTEKELTKQSTANNAKGVFEANAALEEHLNDVEHINKNDPSRRPRPVVTSQTEDGMLKRIATGEKSRIVRVEDPKTEKIKTAANGLTIASITGEHERTYKDIAIASSDGGKSNSHSHATPSGKSETVHAESDGKSDSHGHSAPSGRSSTATVHGKSVSSGLPGTEAFPIDRQSLADGVKKTENATGANRTGMASSGTSLNGEPTLITSHANHIASDVIKSETNSVRGDSNKSDGHGHSASNSGSGTTSIPGESVLSNVPEANASPIDDQTSVVDIGKNSVGSNTLEIIGSGISVNADLTSISGHNNRIIGDVIYITGNGNLVKGNVNSIAGDNNRVTRGRPKSPEDRAISIYGKNNVISARNYGPCSTNRTINGKVIQATNSGIVIDGHTVMYCGFQGYPLAGARVDKRQYSSLTFEDISKRKGRVNDPRNAGYLVHYSPTGFKWRTSDEEIVRRVLSGEQMSIIDDGGYTAYNRTDGHLAWSRNEGIVENGKFVSQSDNVKKRRNYITCRIGDNNVIRWPQYVEAAEDIHGKVAGIPKPDGGAAIATNPIAADTSKEKRSCLKRLVTDGHQEARKVDTVVGEAGAANIKETEKRVSFDDNVHVRYFERDDPPT